MAEPTRETVVHGETATGCFALIHDGVLTEVSKDGKWSSVPFAIPHDLSSELFVVEWADGPPFLGSLAEAHHTAWLWACSKADRSKGVGSDG